MLSDKTEKRMVSSIFIILAPPRRGCGGPAKAPLLLPTEKPVPRKEGRGPGNTPDAGSSALLPPPVEAVLGSLQPASLRVETLGPGLQKGAAPLPTSLQTSEAEEPQPASPLGWTDGQVEEEEAAAPDICAFCHKGISPDAVALEAMRKQYHVTCFTCRVCHSSLAGQSYYQKEGRPLCLACYQETLEKCNACQASILSEIVWAVGKGYHPECFTCVACSQQIGSDAFAVDDDQRALCLPDFYRCVRSCCPWSPPRTGVTLLAAASFAEPATSGRPRILPRKRRRLIVLGIGARRASPVLHLRLLPAPLFCLRAFFSVFPPLLGERARGD
ncbi:filamin-binding LIM protein 1 isoform X2 [Ahaetulla prasina]|uniref:filamin-binding LIM protein 1 isoform X2 n=1 Tax=Ahaetulla prasina TaxID=499056 RepID=UPI0026495D09|nr:filamin-binding LIM protein 1 isoform X2 [Ahaetulla prasina]